MTLHQQRPSRIARLATPDAGTDEPRALAVAGAQDGFSLPEVLVVTLIVGILAAVAIATLTGTATKATTIQAKELARNAETTAETIANEHAGSYAAVTLEELHAVEPTLPIAASTQQAYLSAVTHSESSYSITATATNGAELTIARAANGAVTRTCKSPSGKAYCSGVESSSW